MSERDLVLKMVLQVRDGMSGVIKKATRSSDADFKALQERLQGTADKFDTVGKKAGIIGGILTGISAANVKMAGDFQDSMSNVSTLIDTNVESLDDMGKEVLNLAKRSPVALNDLTEGLYNIRSAGVSAADQFKVLEKSAILGVTGRGSTNEAVDLVTSSLNAFNLKGKEAEKVYDNIFKTVKYGKTTISGIAQGFGATAGVVASANIQLDEYLAAVSAMTTTGNPASQAHTQIKAAVAGLTRGTKEQAEIFRQLGAKNWSDLIKKSGGMVNAFARINKAIGGNQSKMIQLVGSIEAYNAIQSLTGANNVKYLEALNDMRNGQDALMEGYVKKMSTINAKTAVLRNNFQGLGIEFGNALIPAVNGLINVVGGVTSAISGLPDWMKSFVAIGTAGLGVVALGISGVSFAISGTIRGFSDMLNIVRQADILIWGFKGRLEAIKMINFDLRASLLGIKKAFLQIPLVCAKAKANIIAFGGTCKMAAITGFQNILKGIKSGFINFIPNIKKAIAGMRTFNITCSLNPIGLLVAGITAGAFLIYKYWKPITAFFKGMFNGIKEGLAPLQPIFTTVGQAIQPVINAVKGFFTQVNNDGSKAAEWGYKFGRGIAWCINKVIDLCKWFGKAITLGGRIKFKAVDTKSPVEGVNGSHANGLYRVPFDGYKAELHKNESVLTASEANEWRGLKSGRNSSITITYAPQITMPSNADNRAKDDFMQILQKHKRELAEIVESAQNRRFAGAY